MKYPKQPKKRKRMRHKKSILQSNKTTCFLCDVLEGNTRQQYGLHKHHVFFGTANRKLSEEDGLFVYLCMKHHETGTNAVHRDRGSSMMLMICAQEVYEKTHTREEFIKRYGRSYI